MGPAHDNCKDIKLLLFYPSKAFEITYVRLKFYTQPTQRASPSTSVPRRMGHGNRTQYYSASCHKMYGRDNKGFIRPGENERMALCTDEFRDISPLTGGKCGLLHIGGTTQCLQLRPESCVTGISCYFMMPYYGLY